MGFWAAAAPVIAGGATSAFSWLSGEKQAKSNEAIARAQMEWSGAQSLQQMQFQERMANTEWQRGTADMRAAGINPMLSVTQGPASSPGGASGHSAGYPAPNIGGPAVQAGMASALEVMRVAQEIKESNSRIRVNAESAQEKWAGGWKAMEGARLLEQDRKMMRMQNYLMENRLDVERQYPRSFGWLDAILKRGGLLNSAISGYRALGE